MKQRIDEEREFRSELDVSETAIANVTRLHAIRAPRRARPTMRIVRFRGSRRIPIYRDARLRRIDAFNLYAQHIARGLLAQCFSPTSQAYDSGINRVADGLQALSLFLDERSIVWSELTDSMLDLLREWLLEKIQRDPRSRDELSVQRTTNYRLRVVYEFCCWAQETAHLCANLIGKGEGYRIQSVIVEAKKTEKSFPDKRTYPKCFADVGDSSRVSDDQYWATEEDVDKLIAYFRDNRGPAVAERNILVMRLAQYNGWRRNALLSLTIDQFSLENIERAAAKGDTKMLIRPSAQKNGNTFKKPVSILWCRMVHTYICEGRAKIIVRLGLKKSQQSNALFINVDDGTPLTLQHISQEFGEAFKAIRAPKGAGLHSFKRLYGDNTADEIVASFQSRGIALTWENLASTMRKALDHRGDYSWECYIRAVTRLQRQSVEARLREQVTDTSAEIAILEARLNQLETQAAEMESELRNKLEEAVQMARYWKDVAKGRKRPEPIMLDS